MSRDTVIIPSSNSIDNGHEYLVMQQTLINLKKENIIGKYGYIFLIYAFLKNIYLPTIKSFGSERMH